MSAIRGNRMVIAVAVLAIGAAVYWFTKSPDDMDANMGAPLAEVMVPTLDAVAMRGEEVFNENCATCHGKNAAGRNGMGPPLVHIIYEPNHHSDGAFYFAAANGVRSHHWRFGDMPPVEGVSEDEVSDIIAYVRTLQRANGIN